MTSPTIAHQLSLISHQVNLILWYCRIKIWSYAIGAGIGVLAIIVFIGYCVVSAFRR